MRKFEIKFRCCFKPNSTNISCCNCFNIIIIINKTLINFGHANCLSKKVSIQHRSQTTIFIALWSFHTKGKVEAVKYFAPLHSINPSMRFDGCTTLMIAASKGHNDVVEYLLSIDFDVNTKTLFGQSALSMTAYTRIINLLRMSSAHEW